MTTRTLLLAAGLLTVCGAAAQTPPGLPASPTPPGLPASPNLPPAGIPEPYRPAPGSPTGPTLPDLVGPKLGVPSPPSPPSVHPAPPPEPTVEELLRELEALQAEKAKLEKKEQDLKAAVRKKLTGLQDKASKLGAVPAADAPAGPDRVGRLLIEGFKTRDESKVREAVGLRPGQVLHYPELEGARDRLEKLGFKGAAVETVPTEAPGFQDVRIRSASPTER